MKNLIKSMIVTMFLLAGGSAFAAAEAGKDYKLLSPARPTSTQKIEVLEFFFYECPHCFHLHPKMATWEKNMPKDVELTYVPTIFRDSTEPLARAFYALDSMGQLKQHHDAIYQAIHVDRIALRDQGSIGEFLAKKGVDQAKFADAYSSFTVQSKVTRAKQMIRTYAIQGTPSLIVDGKYLITGMSPDNMVSVLNEVIAIARSERSKK